ncbi:RNA helicase family protein [Raphanus sativus]|uniref:RNA helicase n=1 Tax=Raphanus sativus TaxID=3726 RepID=A0A6J0NUZ2_RAPSA|nr:pre-mRNA-splicing factor ATP-dependent RNA helicase DEAH10 [Raphanus sativus]KAJ4916610.1 RNA helicase family protein [Raphanus sativus]
MAQGELKISVLNSKRNPESPIDSRKRKRQKIAEHRKSLPIASAEKRLIELVRKNDVLIIVGETGSGKTTQLPQFLFSAGFCREGKMVGITQPRRIAAMSIAKRVAEESEVELGQRVGYAIRFDDCTSSSTRLKYMTDGFLLREAMLDPLLSRYSVIVVDEAHERTVDTDVLLALLKDVQRARLRECQGRRVSPLKLIIMSASLDASVFSEYFGGAKGGRVLGRQCDVDILYTVHPETDYVEAALATIFQIHSEEEPGDILVFLTGQEEIESVGRLVKERLQGLPEDQRKLLPLSIFAALPSEQQMKAFAPAPLGFRKVILATNIAETSITIPGIRYVIDPGVVKAQNYDQSKRIKTLDVVPVSKAQALQRSGRAGREGDGKCYRLYLESEFWKLEDSTKPEIKRCNLSKVILQLKALGIDDIAGFDFIDKPSRGAIVKALAELYLLGALTDDCKLAKPAGEQMSRLPLDPVYSRALILANQFNCLEEMLITVAMLSVESIFYDPREKREESRTSRNHFASAEGDHLTYLSVYRELNELLEKRKTERSEAKIDKIMGKWCKDNFVNCRSLKHARDIYRQIRGHVEQMGFNVSSCGNDMLEYRRCLAASFFLQAAQRQMDGTYRALESGEIVHIHPRSVLFSSKPECVIFDELIQTSEKFIKNLTRIDPLWLAELAPHHYKTDE